MTVSSSSGTKVFIHPPVSATNARYLDQLSDWVEIGEVEDIDDIGETFGVMQRTFFGNGPRTDHLKTVTTGASVSISIGRDYDDDGQSILNEALSSRSSYLFKVELNDARFVDYVNSRLIFRALVLGVNTAVGGNDNIVRRNASLQINSEIYELPSEPQSDANVSLSLDFVNNRAVVVAPNSPLVSTIDSVVNFTRPTNATDDITGTLETYAPNVLRRADGYGALLERAGTNLVPNSQPTTILTTTPWSERGVILSDRTILNRPMYRCTTNYAPPWPLVQGTGGDFPSAGGVYTFSFIAEGPQPIDMYLSGSGSNYAPSEVRSIGNGLYRHSRSDDVPSGQSISIHVRGNLQDRDIGCFQVETGPVATSYIPTEGATASRAADLLSLTTIPGYNLQEGTFLIEAEVTPFEGQQRLLRSHTGTDSEYAFSVGTNPGAFKTLSVSLYGRPTLSIGSLAGLDKFKVAVSYDDVGLRASLNGGAIVGLADATPLTRIPAFTEIGARRTAADQFWGSRIAQIAYSPRAYTNNELQEWANA